MQTKGPDHIEMLELWDSGMQFQVLFTRLYAEQNEFIIENQRTFEQRKLYRVMEEPRMSVQFIKETW